MGQVVIKPIFVHHEFRWLDPSSYLSLVIRKVIGFWANHTAIKYESDGFVWVVESRSGGIVKATWENWIKHRPRKQWFYGKDISIDEYKISIRLGNQYDVASLFEQVWYRITGSWVGDKSTSQENCSEFIADLLGLPNAYLATPKSLYKLLKK